MRTQNLLWLKLAVLVLAVGLAAGAFSVIRNGYRRRANAPWEAYRLELKASGELLSLAEIEALRPTVLPDDNAALVVENLAEKLGLLKAEAWQMVPLFSKELEHIDPFVGIPQSAVEPMRAFLQEHQDTSDALLRLRDLTGARLTRVSYDFPGDNPFVVTLPSLRPWVDAGKLQHLLALSHLIDGDTDRAADAVAVQFGVASTLRNEPGMMMQSVRGRVLRGAVSAIEAVLRVGELDQERLDELAALIDVQLKSLSPRIGMQFERACMIRLFDGLAAGTVQLSDVYYEPTLSRLGHVSLVEFRDAQLLITKTWTELIEVADDPAELVAVATRLNLAVSPLSMPGRMFLLAGTWMPGGAFADNSVRAVAELRCARAALACERYRLSHNRLPQSFAELIPDFVDSAPIDPFTGEPLSFITTEVGIAVYSVGPNMTDDGGDFTIPRREYHSPDIGFRLARQEKRGTIVAEAAPPVESP